MGITSDSSISVGVKRQLILALIGVCFVLVYDIMVLVGGMGWISQDALIILVLPMEIISTLGLIFIALGFHALYLVYGRAPSRIAFFGFILAPILSFMLLLPPFFANIWLYLAASLIILLGAIAFFDLRSEGTILFVLTSILVIIGVLANVLAFILGAAVFSILDVVLTIVIRTAGRIPMWIFVGATFAWVSKSRATTPNSS